VETDQLKVSTDASLRLEKTPSQALSTVTLQLPPIYRLASKSCMDEVMLTEEDASAGENDEIEEATSMQGV